ncbi:MAG TPA: zf-TFIIB domain-containing protein [Tepidisphaeraceae bacterium]|jgi:Zn-finger nucleic acid-binding protein
MKCPVCKLPQLLPTPLLENLQGFTCEQCAGTWIRGRDYFKWLDGSENIAPAQTAAAPPPDGSTDSLKAKLCPECGHLLRRARVDESLPFHIDRCTNCGGIWLDRDEWQSLAAAGLHDDLHRIFSESWQAHLQRQQRQQQEESLLRNHLGEADFAELQRIQIWIANHPRRNELHAYLLNHMAPLLPLPAKIP